ncbi:hypothetical protein VSU16_14370 (plasmid) [Cetobacterium somerae]|uniref:hypothetical protein n=1 Tax=Cetobacterium somerae TaxID=188913 RepID=UPI002E7AB20D|nr:hypothetical protein [Cetobacterium somerae]WVJ03105.1 hypothetical protein VSU16_14370 [Cetobacterium somerae]
MKLYYDEHDIHYVLLEEVELGQSLKAVFNTSTKELLIVDPDVKDYQGNEYKEKMTAVSKDDGKSIEVGIVQKLTRKTIDDLQNLFDLLELEYSK